jgi:pilus assembly protein Flp/PilA
MRQHLSSDDESSSEAYAEGDSVLSLWTKLVALAKSEKGASMVEYALLVVLIAIIAIVAVSLAGRGVSKGFSTIAASLTN